MRAIQRLALTAGVAVAIAVGGCSKEPDPKANVDRALKDAHIDQVKVDWDRDTHIAHLKGTVDTTDQRERAQELAVSAVGTSGKVLNEVTVKGLNDQNAGDMDRDIKRALQKMVDNDATLKERDIDFDVNNGAVAVKGKVRTAAEKAKLTELVRSAPGVKDFANAVEIEPQK